MKNSNSKLKDDYSPLLTEEDNLKYNCPVSHMVDTKQYRIDIDQDPCKALIYLNIGYDDLTDYDSPIYLDAYDALDLANRLLNFSTIAISNNNKGSFTNIFVENLESELKNKNIRWLSVFPVDLANQDYFLGCMILDVKYRTKDNSKKLHFARILSCNFLMKNCKILDRELAQYIQETYDVSMVKLFPEEFKIKYDSIIELYRSTNPQLNLSEEDIEEIKNNTFDELKNFIVSQNNLNSNDDSDFD